MSPTGPDENGQRGTVNGFPITENTIDALAADAEVGFPNLSAPVFKPSGDADRTSTLPVEGEAMTSRADEILATAQRVHSRQERTYALDEVEGILASDDPATDQQAE